MQHLGIWFSRHLPASKPMDQDKPVFSNLFVHSGKVPAHESEGVCGDPHPSHCQILDPDLVWVLTISDVLRFLDRSSGFFKPPKYNHLHQGKEKNLCKIYMEVFEFQRSFFNKARMRKSKDVHICFTVVSLINANISSSQRFYPAVLPANISLF